MPRILAIVIIALLLGLIPGSIAQGKGHSFGAWWLFGAALFIVALPMAIMLKPDPAAIERQQLDTGLRKCPYCAEVIKREAVVCRFCGRDVPPVEVTAWAVAPVEHAPASTSTPGQRARNTGILLALLGAVVAVALLARGG